MIAKLSSFVLKEQYKYFSATTNIPDEKKKGLPKHISPSFKTTEISHVNFPFLFNRPPVPMYYKLLTLIFV